MSLDNVKSVPAKTVRDIGGVLHEFASEADYQAWACGNPTHEIVEGGVASFDGPSLEHSVWFEFGDGFVHQHDFETHDEVNAFVEGVSAAMSACGITDYRQWDTLAELTAAMAEDPFLSLVEVVIVEQVEDLTTPEEQEQGDF